MVQGEYSSYAEESNDAMNIVYGHSKDCGIRSSSLFWRGAAEPPRTPK